MAEPRPSTDEERATLLVRQRDDGDLLDETRPMTKLEMVLAASTVFLLVIAGTFIGLFAGTEVALNKERQHHKHGHHHDPSYPAPPSDVCTSSDCVIAAAEILKSMNSSADPCEDFYEFANGGWLDQAVIPADRGLIGSFHQVADSNKRIIVKIIESIPVKDHEDPKALDAQQDNLQKLRAVYDSCMNVDTLNHLGTEKFMPLAKHVVNSFGKFDASPEEAVDADWVGTFDESYVIPDELLVKAEEAAFYRAEMKRSPRETSKTVSTEPLFKPDPIPKERQQRITKTLAWLHARGVDTLLNFAIEGDAGGEDSQVQSLWLYQSFGGLPSKEYYEEKPIVDLYTSVVASMLKHIAKETGANLTKRDLVSDMMLDAAESFIEGEEGWPWPWPGDDDDDKDKEPKKPKQPTEPLGKRMDKLAIQVVKLEREIVRAGTDLEYLFNPHYSYNPKSADDVNDAISFLDLPEYLSTFAPRTYPVNITVTYPPYLKSISKIVADTPDNVLSAYFVTKLALAYAPALGPEVPLRQDKRRLEEVLGGIKKGTEENRETVCLNWVDNIVGFIAGREFVRETFPPEAKEDGEKIIRSIVSAFSDSLPDVKWMDAESAKAAQKKAEAIIPKVGYPRYPDTLNPDSLKAWYSRLKIDRFDFFDNVLNSELLTNARVWGTLGNKRNRESWEMNPQTVNAYYSPPDGEIVFPAGILRPPFYSLSWPEYMRYGAFGAVAAHELTHAFDNSGAQYDEKGRLRDWWTNKTVAAFEERAQCIAKQYSQYYVLDAEGNKVHVNGNLTNGEDIADSGLKQAYSAWKNLRQEQHALPGLKYSPEQLFFLSYARVWAQLTRPATAVARVRTDPHSPPYWRATGTLRNLPAFHEAFGCKLGSGMNPKNQCEVW